MLPTFRPGTCKRQMIGTTILRVTLGGVFLAHGLQKLLVWGLFGGTPFFADAGIPFPGLAAPATALLETLGGACLILGIATRPAAATLSVIMLVAAVTVHLPHGFFAPDGVELVLVLGAALLVLVLQGSGALSLGEWARAVRGAARQPVPDVSAADVDRLIERD